MTTGMLPLHLEYPEFYTAECSRPIHKHDAWRRCGECRRFRRACVMCRSGGTGVAFTTFWTTRRDRRTCGPTCRKRVQRAGGIEAVRKRQKMQFEALAARMRAG